MSFEARYIPADEAPLDAQGEIVLPDDLAELAAQLSDDASYLATCYPAPGMNPSASSNAQPTKRSRWWLPAVASVVLAMVGWGSWQYFQQSVENNHGTEVVAAAYDSDSSAVPFRFDVSANSVSTNSPYSNDWVTESDLPPQFILYEYSGPELEGLYDLLETPQVEVEF
jgi:hypothetical protein